MPLIRPRVFCGENLKQDGRVPISAQPHQDGVISAITKWIPIEIIAFYQGVTTPFGGEISHWLIPAIVAGFIVTFLWVAFATEDAQAKSRIAWRQVILGCTAFIFWVIGTTSPDIWKTLAPWWHAGINPAMLATGTILLPIFDAILRRLGVPQD